jgi:hypothetical protein
MKQIASTVTWTLAFGLLLVPEQVVAQDALRGPPPTGEPVEVAVGLHLIDIVDINPDEKTFEFGAVLTMRWTDARLAFDPDEVGTDEKVFQGNYQFAEIYPGWWPPLALRNESGRYETQAVVLRVDPAGSASYVEEVQAVAEINMDLRRVPFDRQVFHIEFAVLGYGADRVLLIPDTANIGLGETSLLQWRMEGVNVSTASSGPAPLGERGQMSSAIMFQYPVVRSPFYILRSVVFPIMILVGLSWSVFWMDRESVGNRMDISFIAILTVVAFQIVIADRLPRITYFTLISSFMYLSYLTLSAAVVINLRVAALDKRGDVVRGDRLDRTCRWLFPLGYLAVLGLTVAYFLLRY